MKHVCVLVLTLSTTMTFAQMWQGPYQLTTDGASDINPAVCREWVFPNMTCMVWQTNRNGNWDIYSRFCSYVQGNGWMSEEPITLSAAEDINPAVASVNDMHDSPSYWCIWERAESPVMHTVRAAFFTWRDQWRDTALLAHVPLNPGEAATPSAIVMQGGSLDTTWVVWHGHDTSGHYIGYAFHDGVAWCQPGVVVWSANPIAHVRIGRGTPPGQSWPCCPLLVWEKAGDIYYSEYLAGNWTTPVSVAPSGAYDCAPEVVSRDLMLGMDPSIVWQSTRGGDTAIYGTTLDSIATAERLCNPSPCGSNLAPSGVPAAFPVLDQNSFITVWTTSRNGNPDIYSSAVFTGQEDIPVNQNPALDSNPVITAMGLTEVWCCWQSDRSGNWDLWGSFIYASGIEEGATLATAPPALEVLPNPCHARTELRLSPALGHARELRIHDHAGRLVRTLPVSYMLHATFSSLTWDCTDNTGRRVPDGCYFVSLKTDRATIRRKLIVTK